MSGNERRSFFQGLITASHLWLYYLPHFQSWCEKYAQKSRTLCADFAALFSPQDAPMISDLISFVHDCVVGIEALSPAKGLIHINHENKSIRYGN
jgi:hypothetical protein